MFTLTIVAWKKIINGKKLFRYHSTTKVEYDVIIAGAGSVGSSFLLGILKIIGSTNGKVAIIDQHNPIGISNSEDSLPDVRVYALSPQSIIFFQSLGTWKLIKERSQIYDEMRIWEHSYPNTLSFSASNLNIPELGRIVEDRTIQASNFAQIQSMGLSYDSFFGYSISSLNCSSTSVHQQENSPIVHTVTLQNLNKEKRTITGRLLIGADGGNSIIRRLSGISTWGWGYGQEALIGTVKLSSNVSATSSTATTDTNDTPNSTAYQVYHPGGTLALLPLWDQYASFVWSLPTPIAQSYRALNSSNLIDALNTQLSRSSTSSEKEESTRLEEALGPDWLPTSYRMLRSQLIHTMDVLNDSSSSSSSSYSTTSSQSSGGAQRREEVPPIIEKIVSDVVSFPLQLQQARSYVAPGIALIGDAAHSIHPQAGQGLNLGLRDVQDLLNTLEQGVNNGMSINDQTLLNKYNHLRYSSNLKVMLGVDQIHRCFQMNFMPFNLLRSFGLSSINRMESIKAEFIKIATGLGK